MSILPAVNVNIINIISLYVLCKVADDSRVCGVTPISSRTLNDNEQQEDQTGSARYGHSVTASCYRRPPKP